MLKKFLAGSVCLDANPTSPMNKTKVLIHHLFVMVLFAGCLPLFAAPSSNNPISLHPHNSHYFLWRGQPRIFITSAEHYGALLNLDFDYQKYIDTLSDEGMNMTRLFSGAYCEPDGAFNISRNTLAPLKGKFIAPIFCPIKKPCSVCV
jgi:hypothetical protein